MKMKRFKKCIIVILTALMVSNLCGCQMPTYKAPEKISDYLYYIDYEDYKNEIIGENENVNIKGGCTSVRSGKYFGRNLDMTYSECPEFVVHISGNKNRFESIGVAANPYITYDVGSMSVKELQSIPAITNDGINENGVVASVHVVYDDGLNYKDGTYEGMPKLDARNVVRYVLDNAESAKHAVELLEEVNIVGGFENYKLHWMIADSFDTYIVEIIDCKLAVCDDLRFLTNFYVNYGNIQIAQDVLDKAFFGMPFLTDHAVGVERWDYIRSHYLEIEGFDSMLQLMKDVKATRAYDLDRDDVWYTEFVDEEHSINSDYYEFLEKVNSDFEAYLNRDRKDPKGDWITWHTAIYDIKERMLYIYSQEDYDNQYAFKLIGK